MLMSFRRTKTRNIHQLHGGNEAPGTKKLGATLNSKIGAALETVHDSQGVGGFAPLKATTVSSSLRLQVGHSDRNYHGKLQKLNALQPSKGRSESNPAPVGSLNSIVHNSSNLNSGEHASTPMGLPKPSHTLSDRQSLNTISHPADYSAQRVNKPQFSAKNGIEPISGPKAPPQMQNFDSAMEPRGGRANDRLRSLDAAHVKSNNLVLSPRASANIGGASGGNCSSNLAKTLSLGGPGGPQHQSSRAQYQTVTLGSHQKTPKLA